MDKAELTYNLDGVVVVIAAKNPITGVLEEFCLPTLKDFPQWSADYKRQGYELVEVDINRVMEELTTPPKSLH